jgi:DNA replication protein DnaC
MGYVYSRRPDGSVDYSKVVPCVCVKQKVERECTAALLEYCALPKGTDHMTFATFDTRGQVLLQAALAMAREFASPEPLATPVLALTLMGESDHGKSHMAIAIARAKLAQGVAAKYYQVPAMLDELRLGFKNEGDNSHRARFDKLCRVSVLILDDLGTQKNTSWAIEQIQMLLEYRLLNGLPTVVTTNCPIDALLGNKDAEQRMASMRIGSRLRRERHCRIIVLGGPESRLWRLAE